MQQEMTKGGTENKKDKCDSSNDFASALKTYLNHIPISSLPDFTHSQVLELKVGDSVRDAVKSLYEKNAPVALISDMTPNNSSNTNNVVIAKPSDKYIGVISFATLVLWCFEVVQCRLQKDGSRENEKKAENQASKGFFSMLEQNPHINETKVGELAKSFLWKPFFPVHLEDDTLFHVLLLLSKHRLQVVPVIERSKHKVIGFITENAILKFLLQSSGSEWFDSIANTTLSEFRFSRKDGVYKVYSDQSISEALFMLTENRIDAVAVIDQNTKELLGTLTNRDISILLDNDRLFSNAKTTSVAKLMELKSHKDGLKGIIESEHQHPSSNMSGRFCVGKNSASRMDSLVVHRETNTLKQVMEKMVETNSESSFLVDELWQVSGMINLRDILVEFAPPCLNSGVVGGGFFESALQQTGYHIENDTMVSNH